MVQRYSTIVCGPMCDTSATWKTNDVQGDVVDTGGGALEWQSVLSTPEMCMCGAAHVCTADEGTTERNVSKDEGTFTTDILDRLMKTRVPERAT